jgi:RNA polymerase sigma-70 factor (sigma-E family)
MGSGDEFAAFYAGYGRRLLHLAQLLTGNADYAEDLLQDVLSRAYARWDRIRVQDPYIYVRRGLVNARTDRWRRRVPVPTVIREGELVFRDHASDVVRHDDLLRALQTLTLRERTVIALRFFEDLSEKQTAAALGVPPGTVKSATNRAVVKLRQHPALQSYLVGDPL